MIRSFLNSLLVDSRAPATLKSQFKLEDILDYIKTGIALVVEDEVTHRLAAKCEEARTVGTA